MMMMSPGIVCTDGVLGLNLSAFACPFPICFVEYVSWEWPLIIFDHLSLQGLRKKASSYE